MQNAKCINGDPTADPVCISNFAFELPHDSDRHSPRADRRVREPADSSRASFRARSGLRSRGCICGRGRNRPSPARRRADDGRAQSWICQQGHLARAETRHARLGAHVRRHRAVCRREHGIARPDSPVLAENRAGDRLQDPNAAERSERGRRRAERRRVDRARVRDHRLRVRRLDVSAGRLRGCVRAAHRAHRRRSTSN